jgi:dynein assembly factor 2, axonemal
MSLKDWEKMEISSTEFSRISEAMKNEEFRKMFISYCEEISDPENRKLYEKEIKQLESERGVDVEFINPKGILTTYVDNIYFIGAYFSWLCYQDQC